MRNHSRVLILFALFVGFAGAGVAVGADRKSCSFNGGASSSAQVTSSSKILSLSWDNGLVVRLIRISSREFVDSSGARWFQMSNREFFGLWSEDGNGRKEIYCKNI